MTMWKKVAVLLVVALLGFIGYGYWEIFGEWPVTHVARLTQITNITFPASAQLVSGYDQHGGPSEMAFAKLRMPYKDLAAFQSQSHMSAFETGASAQVDRSIAAGFGRHGWSLARVQHLQRAFFSNGSCTFVWIDRDAAQQATVYIYYDEP
jgi:hypothetical protein